MGSQKVNLVIACWAGSRRTSDEQYTADPSIHIQHQIRQLGSLQHNLTQITFANNKQEQGESKLYRTALGSLPSKIGNADVQLIEQPNKGMSYGLFDLAYRTYKDAFDYYILLEDDYTFVMNNFDAFLIKRFKAKKNCGYLCGYIEQSSQHAVSITGIVSKESLQSVFCAYSSLPHAMSKKSAGNYPANEYYGQYSFSKAFSACGMKLYDIASDCNVPFWSLDGSIIWIGGYDSSKKSLFMPIQTLRR